jgi:hypothetical protein
MCEECGEAPVQFVAYFNKPGGKHWRPPQRGATTPLVTPAPGALPARFSCDDPVAAPLPPMARSREAPAE